MFKAIPVPYHWSEVGHRSVKDHNVLYAWVEKYTGRLGDALSKAVRLFAVRVIVAACRLKLFRSSIRKAVMKIRYARVVSSIEPRLPDAVALYIADYNM